MKIATYGVMLLAFLIAALFIAHDLREPEWEPERIERMDHDDLLKLARANEAGRAINGERGDA